MIFDTSAVNMRYAHELAQKNNARALIRYLLGVAKECDFRRCDENEWAYRDVEKAQNNWGSFGGRTSRFRKFLSEIHLSPDCPHEIIKAVEEVEPKSFGLHASWPTKQDLYALVFYCGFVKLSR